MNTLFLLAVTALAGVTVQRVCGLMSAHLRSRRCIAYLRYSIDERSAHAIRFATPARPPTSFRRSADR